MDLIDLIEKQAPENPDAIQQYLELHPEDYQDIMGAVYSLGYVVVIPYCSRAINENKRIEVTYGSQEIDPVPKLKVK